MSSNPNPNPDPNQVGCYLALLLTLLAGLHRDDGAGRLYGSGVEIFWFVCAVLLLGTATTTGIYFMVPTVEDGTAQLAGVTRLRVTVRVS